MLERDMEAAIASCPDLFIESGLTLQRRQIVIGGRRPDILFADTLSRHLLVEIQSGRLDEDHVQRHFYYYFDYRAKYPKTHPRLMFIANRIVPQHKEFLDEHGYEYREYPENEFQRRSDDCLVRQDHAPSTQIETVTTPGILSPRMHEILFAIEMQKMTLCYKMLLLMYMSELCDETGRVPLRTMAEHFQMFFVRRAAEGKQEENPNVVTAGTLSARSLSAWERTIREQPVHYLGEQFVIDEGPTLHWSEKIWSQWNSDLKHEIYQSALDRLIRYFERNVPGGF